MRWNVRLKSKSSFPLSWIRRLKPPHPIIRNLRGSMAEKQSCDDALTGLMDEWERLFV